MDTRKGGIRNGKVGMKGHKCKKSNLGAYSLTSQYSLAAFICVFMFPYLSNHLVLTSFPYAWTYLCNPKCLFVVVNVIVLFLVGESRAGAGAGTGALPFNEIYEEYVKRGRRMRRSAGIKKLLPDDHQEEERAGDQRLVIRGGGEDGGGEMEKRMVDDNKEEVIKLGEETQKEEECKKKVVDEERQKEEGEEKVVEEEEKEIVVVMGEKDEEKKGKVVVVVLMKKEEEEEMREVMMPREELNMRVEAFIARVNRQRQMESRLVSTTCLG